MGSESPDYYLDAVARLTGDTGRYLKHSIKQFRITVTASDGKRCGVTIRVGTKRVYKNTRKQIANSLRIEPEQLDDALENWMPDTTRNHLQRFPSEVLDSPADERRFASD